MTMISYHELLDLGALHPKCFFIENEEGEITSTHEGNDSCLSGILVLFSFGSNHLSMVCGSPLV